MYYWDLSDLLLQCVTGTLANSSSNTIFNPQLGPSWLQTAYGWMQVSLLPSTYYKADSMEDGRASCCSASIKSCCPIRPCTPLGQRLQGHDYRGYAMHRSYDSPFKKVCDLTAFDMMSWGDRDRSSQVRASLPMTVYVPTFSSQCQGVVTPLEARRPAVKSV